jgi:riboflavin kinase/FMN adenylyltransferase
MTLLHDDTSTAPRATRSPGRARQEARARIPIWHGLENLPADLGCCVAALGVFDGVHRGHARLLEHAVQLGRDGDLPVVLVTFDPHPARVVGAPRDTSTLSNLDQRADWAAELGIDAVAVLPFTHALAALTPTDFVEQVLVQALLARVVVVGANFTFGAHAAGTTETLSEVGGALGFTTHPVDLLPVVDATCSSTYIRVCLQRGDVAGAARALGRPHQVDARLDDGVLRVDEDTALPAPGRYRARVVMETTDAAGAPMNAEIDTLVAVDDERRLHLRPRRPPHQDGARVLVSFLARSRR